MGPHPGLPGMGPAAAAGLLGFGAGLPAPAAHVSGGSHPLLKPADLHTRESSDLKGPGSANTEERLVNVFLISFWKNKIPAFT